MDLETHNLIEPKVLIADDEYPNRLLIGTMGQKIYDGAGIGLAIIKKQIGMLNGTIQLESKLGIGSKFTVKIPITQC